MAACSLGGRKAADVRANLDCPQVINLVTPKLLAALAMADKFTYKTQVDHPS
jgi:hypothetical protein